MDRGLGEDVNWVPPEWSRACSKHFHPDDFVQTQSLVRLRPCAVPKFFPQHEHAGTTSGAEATVEGTMESPVLPQVYIEEKEQHASELLWDPLVSVDTEEAERPQEVHSTSALTKENSVELPLTSLGVSSSPYAIMTKLCIYALSCNVT
ncbi:uncharacterized protein LOC135387241 [Ornithodoros turicata]|uniref:uncharacterized protein LOC135387241 n=1 Tax=Ornithodoros turicata TaxID=34597 RepID=UPI00313A1789